MLQSKKKITYNNSRMSTLYNTMLTLNYEDNRALLFRYKYRQYTRYLNQLIRGNITRDKSLELSNMLSVLVSELNDKEYKDVFEIAESGPVAKDVIIDSGYTFYVVNRSRTRYGATYFIFKNSRRDFLLEPYHSYVFDLSDPSNFGTRLSFSEEENTHIPYSGIEYINTPGTEGAKLILSIYGNGHLLYIFDERLTGELAYDSGYSTPYLRVHANKFPVGKLSLTTLANIRQFSNIAIYDDRGPKISINDCVNPSVMRETSYITYCVTYGTYYLEIPKIYACTLLNKGYEDYVTFIGDPNFCIIDNVFGTSLAPGPIQEGSYSFYYGRVEMIVKKPFPFDMSLYSCSFGFMNGMGILKFTEPYKPVETSIISLSRVNTITNYTTLRFNKDETKRKYGLSMGMYIIYTEQPIAFIRYEHEEFISVSGTGVEGISPDGFSCTFYTGQITIIVKGYFNKISICTPSGYSGGYKLFMYNSYYGAPQFNLPLSEVPHKILYPQNRLNLLTNSIAFNTDYQSQVYTLYNGEYMIFHMHSSYPITLLNKGKEQYISLETLQPTFTLEGLGPNGVKYTFYYGVFKIKVTGNFNTMSLYSREMNGGLGNSMPIFTYGIS